LAAPNGAESRRYNSAGNTQGVNMGVRGELFSTKVSLQNRTYFFNVKENRLGDLYLNIVESKNKDEGGFERQSVILFADDLQDFLKGFDESLRVLEKSIREKRRGAKSPTHGDKPPSRQTPRGEKDNERFEPGRKREYSRGGRDSSERGRPERTRSSKSFERPERRSERPGRPRTRVETNKGRDSSPHKEHKDFAPRKKRVVVKKK
jgi:hypothetical protein